MRKRSVRTTLVLALTLVAVLLVPNAVWSQDEQAEGGDKSRPGFLTAPSSEAPENIAVDFVKARRQELGLTAADIADVVVTDAYESSHTGITHVYLRQRHRELEVVGANTTVNIAEDGSVVHAVTRFMPNLAAAAAGQASLDALEAAERAARQLDLRLTEDLRILTRLGGPERETVVSEGGVSEEPIPAKLVYQPTEDGKLRLAWNVEIEEPSGEHWWNASIDAETGELLATVDYVDQDNVEDVAAAIARPAAATASGTGTSAATSTTTAAQADGASYRVYGLPLETPNDGERSVVTDPADPLASPFGWHDTDGAAGPEFTRTRGNNVHAYTDHNNSGTPDPGSDPDGGPGLVFDFPLDLTQHPHEYSDAAVTNLFYWNNIIHDVFYGYGFDEASGNFQVNNYGRGGLGGDDVRGEAQDGGGMNNANFATPVDGNRPRMQMYLWSSGLPNLVTVDAPSSAAGTYPASGANFGPDLDETGFSGDIVVVNDGSGAPSEGCGPLIDFPADAIALVDRGTCPFVDKVRNAQDAGAVAVIVANNAGGAPITMGGSDPTITIPSVMITLANGNTIKDGLPATGRVHRNPETAQMRDGDLDSGIIVHEYGHGISNRLTGGPNTGGCLGNQEQMGEGWSDWLAVALTALPSESGEQARGIGTYALFQPSRTSQGIRPTAYSTDMNVNPATYDDIQTLAVPHGVGYVWATMLWEVYWDLVDKHGFNPDVYGDWESGGNNLAIQLVMDGMKFQPCRPGFVDGRDAILAADLALTGGENQCVIWRGFAKRGLGFSAVQGSSESRADNTEAFDNHPDCRAQAEVSPDTLAASAVEDTQEAVELTVSNAALPDGEALTWTIAEAEADCSSPSDLGWVNAAPASGTTAAAGASTVTVTFDATGLTAPDVHTGFLCLSSNDEGNPAIAVPLSLQIQYPFAGFFRPLQEEINDATAPSVVPVLFSLGGDRGLSILASGSPSSQQIDCTTLEPAGPAAPTTTPGNSRLSYDAGTDRYNYPWRTSVAWAGTCRALIVELDDGSEHVAHVRFE